VSGWARVKRIVGENGKRYVDIEVGSLGLFRFTECSEDTDMGYVFMTPTHQSGLYESADAAEREARAMLPWLRAISD